ncbi:unnamed protein product, partial [Prorocentrum cordatum]
RERESMAAAAPWARALAAAALAVSAAATDGRDPAPRQDRDATPTPPAVRHTWTNCECKVNWVMDDLDGNSLTCNEACCNLDDDPFGDYCYVVDPACEEFEWGYCRPESMSTPGCTDRPAGWSDSDGDDCYAYAYNGFCTTSGGYGAAWQEDDWGTLEDYTQDGYDASTACCACGGGSGTYQGYDDTKCADSAGWADSDGDDCTSYTQFFWCTPDGHTGTGWHEESGAPSPTSRRTDRPPCRRAAGAAGARRAPTRARRPRPSPTATRQASQCPAASRGSSHRGRVRRTATAASQARTTRKAMGTARSASSG